MIPTRYNGHSEARRPTDPNEPWAPSAGRKEPSVTPSGRKLLVKPEEAATILSVGRSTVYDLMASGELESVRIKGSRRIPIAAIERFVERLLDESPRRWR